MTGSLSVSTPSVDTRNTYLTLNWEQSIRKHCICGKYYNPDVILVACPNKECHIWMHEECIINDALTKAYNALPANLEEKKKKNNKKGAVKRLTADKLSQDLSYPDAIYRKRLTGKVIDRGNKICITDLLKKKILTEKLCCLKCSTALG